MRYWFSVLALLFTTSFFACGEGTPGTFTYQDGWVRFYDANGFNACGYVLEIPSANGLILYLPQSVPSAYQIDGLPVRADISPLGSLITCQLGFVTTDLEEVYINSIQTR